MKKRILALVLAFVMVLGVLAGCGKSGAVTEEQAMKIAKEASGYSDDQITDIHTHLTTENGIPCYSIHLTTVNDGEFSYLIHAGTGEIIQ